MRTATIRTDHPDAATVAAAVAPDNTPEMETRVEGDAVVTTIERNTTSGLQSTVDDYVVNVDIAETIANHARSFGAATRNSETENSETENSETENSETENSETENSETTDTNARTNTNTQ
jgi:hypothetical protein